MKNIVKALSRRILGKYKSNFLFDAKLISITDDVLSTELGIKIRICNLTQNELRTWISKADLNEFQYRFSPRKKVLEFFFSHYLLEIQKDDIILDAAGGKSKFLSAINKHTENLTLILQDHIYGSQVEKNGITVVGGDISNISLPDESVNKVSCHHAFEHFKDNKDQLFVKEIARLLKPCGKAVIIPVFIANKYAEVWNIRPNLKFDVIATTLVDKTASLPGSNADGHFARVYDPIVFKKRVVNYAETLGLKWALVTCMLDSANIPDMQSNLGAKINNPLRALVLTKIKKISK